MGIGGGFQMKEIISSNVRDQIWIKLKAKHEKVDSIILIILYKHFTAVNYQTVTRLKCLREIRMFFHMHEKFKITDDGWNRRINTSSII